MTLKTAICGVALGAAVVLTGIGAGSAAATAPANPASGASTDDWTLVGYYDTLHACQVDGAWYVHHTSGAKGYDCRPGGPKAYGLVLIF
jgi:hypothetical protein